MRIAGSSVFGLQVDLGFTQFALQFQEEKAASVSVISCSHVHLDGGTADMFLRPCSREVADSLKANGNEPVLAAVSQHVRPSMVHVCRFLPLPTP